MGNYNIALEYASQRADKDNGFRNLPEIIHDLKH